MKAAVLKCRQHVMSHVIACLTLRTPFFIQRRRLVWRREVWYTPEPMSLEAEVRHRGPAGLEDRQTDMQIISIIKMDLMEI